MEEGWVEYTGQRNKEMHSLRLKNGTEYKHCYPNGISWYVYGEPKHILPPGYADVADSQVQAIKPLGYGLAHYMCKRASL